MYQHILVPTDGTPLSASAVKEAVSLAKTVGAKVTVLTVIHRLPTLGLGPSYPYADEFSRHAHADAERTLTEAEQEARCLIPGFDGAVFSREWKDALWARFSTGAPRRQRQSVERYSIVKRA
ncbi:universal stress protein [Methylobacterium durans]|uniref:UspA domain-containing protein n=1 Tax=Methylobacterium durans TaxID=2202825 RepID=A0A2U8WF45_9HYPH|nr:universal stress protein [Methylobacterium durans]AWN44743.1 hypothetical protein DK389_23235 [Methylobacterium durans]